MTTQTRQPVAAECGQYHSGNHQLTWTSSQTAAECQGCGYIYSRAEIEAAITSAREASHAGGMHITPVCRPA